MQSVPQSHYSTGLHGMCVCVCTKTHSHTQSILEGQRLFPAHSCLLGLCLYTNGGCLHFLWVIVAHIALTLLKPTEAAAKKWGNSRFMHLFSPSWFLKRKALCTERWTYHWWWVEKYLFSDSFHLLTYLHCLTNSAALLLLSAHSEQSVSYI